MAKCYYSATFLKLLYVLKITLKYSVTEQSSDFMIYEENYGFAGKKILIPYE